MNEDKWYKNYEMMVALSALLLSLVTAMVSIYSAYADRSFARAAMWPRIEISHNHYDKHFDIVIRNGGNGPALIKYAVVKQQSKPIKNWNEIDNIPRFTKSYFGSRILTAQQTIKPVKYEGEENGKVFKIFRNIEIKLCYCSVYEECWTVKSGNVLQSVDSCIVDEKISFNG